MCIAISYKHILNANTTHQCKILECLDNEIYHLRGISAVIDIFVVIFVVSFICPK